MKLTKAIVKGTIELLFITLLFSACDQNANHKTIGSTQDTNNVNRAGGPPIRDTPTINKDRRDSAAMRGNPKTAKGNADPSGRIKNQ